MLRHNLGMSGEEIEKTDGEEILVYMLMLSDIMEKGNKSMMNAGGLM